VFDYEGTEDNDESLTNQSEDEQSDEISDYSNVESISRLLAGHFNIEDYSS
jgi:hypothetical protein